MGEEVQKTSQTTRSPATSVAQARIRRQARGLAVGLLLVIVLGYITGGGADLPDDHPGVGDSAMQGALSGLGWAITAGGGWRLMLHAILGTVLLITMTLLVVAAIRLHHKLWMIASITGAVLILSAYIGGLTFINRGGHRNAALVMTVGSLAALGVYVGALIATRPPSKLVGK